MNEVPVGSLVEIAMQTKIPNTTDLSMRTAFGWTGVEIRINKYGSHVNQEILGIVWDEKENTISLVIKNEDIEDGDF